MSFMGENYFIFVPIPVPDKFKVTLTSASAQKGALFDKQDRCFNSLATYFLESFLLCILTKFLFFLIFFDNGYFENTDKIFIVKTNANVIAYLLIFQIKGSLLNL